MNEEYVNLELINNKTDQRFEMNVNGNKAIIEYQRYPDKIALLHTEVQPQLEGKRAATAIIEKALAYLEKNNLKLIPLCPLVVVYLKRHPEWKRLVDEELTNT